MNGQIDAVTAPYTGRGGKRPGAGRPPELAKQLADAKKLASQLRQAVKSGLLKLAADYPALIDLAVQLAMQGDTKVLLHLLELPGKLGFKLEDDGDGETPAQQVAARFRMQIEAQMVQAQPAQQVVEGEPTHADPS